MLIPEPENIWSGHDEIRARVARNEEYIMADNKGLNPEILSCLKQIILIMKEDELSEVSIEQKDMKIKVKRMSERHFIANQGLAMLSASEAAVSSPATDAADSSDDLVIIKAPMVGTFYRAPSPEAEPLVNVGDDVEVDQVICVIDAMKLMNEITADISGEVADILVEDGQPVEYDQPIFRIRPK